MRSSVQGGNHRDRYANKFSKRYEPFGAHATETRNPAAGVRLRTRRADLARNNTSRGRWAASAASWALLVTEVMSETRSRVAAWFCFRRTTGAPAISNVRMFFDPASLKWMGFSSMPQIRSARSF